MHELLSMQNLLNELEEKRDITRDHISTISTVCKDNQAVLTLTNMKIHE